MWRGIAVIVDLVCCLLRAHATNLISPLRDKGQVMQIQHIEETFHSLYFTSSSIDGLSLKYIYIVIEKKNQQKSNTFLSVDPYLFAQSLEHQNQDRKQTPVRVCDIQRENKQKK